MLELPPMHRLTRWLVYHVVASYAAAVVTLSCAYVLGFRPAIQGRELVLAPALAPGAAVVLWGSSHRFAPVEGRYWFFLAVWVVLFAAVAAPHMLIRHRRAVIEARAAEGLCLYCGYDLRANPTRCPECGMLCD